MWLSRTCTACHVLLSTLTVAKSANIAEKWLACQSLDNKVLVYGTKDRFRQHRRKQFVGHTVAGYACQVSFSPDGKFLSSGDAEGNVTFWEWKTCRMLSYVFC